MKLPAPNAPMRRKKSRPVRQKHVPVRTCVSCRESNAKRSLTRIVRTPEGDVRIDPTGKLNGRGAYLCDKPQCWEKGISTPILARALNTVLTPESKDALKEFAAGLAPPTADVEPGAHSQEPAS